MKRLELGVWRARISLYGIFCGFLSIFLVFADDDVFMRNGLPRRLRSIRERINLESSLRSVDYPVFGEALLSIGEDLHVDWFAPLEWEAAFEPVSIYLCIYYYQAKTYF